MIKKTIKYTDYNGVEKTEDFYFNLTKAELIEMEATTPGGMLETLKKITGKVDAPVLMRTFKNFILDSYGEITADGRFRKSAELKEAFSQTAAYDELFTELILNGASAAEFMNGIIPQGIAQLTQKSADKSASGSISTVE